VNALLHAAVIETARPPQHPTAGPVAPIADPTRHAYRHPALAPVPVDVAAHTVRVGA